MDLTGAAALMNVQTLRYFFFNGKLSDCCYSDVSCFRLAVNYILELRRCWLHLRCPVFQLPDWGVRGRPPLKICSRRHDKWRAYSSPPPQSTDDFTGEEDYAEDSSEEPMPKTLTKEEVNSPLKIRTS